MIRERVNIHGRARPMEPKEDVPALQLQPGDVGIIKEAPTLRWLKGQEQWDQQYRKDAERAVKQRHKIEGKAQRMLDNARDQGLLLSREGQGKHTSDKSGEDKLTPGAIQLDRRWGPLDLDEEQPPPTAIAKRRDTVSLYNSWMMRLWLNLVVIAGSAGPAKKDHLSHRSCDTSYCAEAKDLGRYQGSVRPQRRP